MVSPVTPGEGWSGSDPEVWRLPPDGRGRDLATPPKRIRHRPPSQKRQAAQKELRVLGWNSGSAEPPTAWDKEPLVTVKSAPKLFAYGIPSVLVVGLIMVLSLWTYDLKTALLVSLSFQAAGFAGIYGIAQRRRADPLRKHLPGSDLTPM